MKYKIAKQNFLYISCLYFLLYFPSVVHLSSDPSQSIKYVHVINWATKLGNELWNLGGIISRKNEVSNSFKKAQVVSRNGSKILNEMANDLRELFNSKIKAVEQIVNAAEDEAIIHEDDEVDILFPYYNSKEMVDYKENETILPTARPMEFFENKAFTQFVTPNSIVLKDHPHFGMPVNMSLSSVHVPDNVFDRDSDVIQVIQWSENLNDVFRENYKNDPSLSFQFFGSNKGIMRQYPAAKWDADEIDLYDCRLRTWYISAANSPKDVIILIDNSGSMRGLSKEIANQVVKTILETLGPNDYVNIFRFNYEVVGMVPCFGDDLVQATIANVYELKASLSNFNTTGLANFTTALSKAFHIMEKVRQNRIGALCNQAIMLVSDGFPSYNKELFEQSSWMNSSEVPVRVFTFLVGIEVEEYEVLNIKRIACENRGYYVHLDTIQEVREEVLNYIGVMARPLVLSETYHPTVWSNFYADAFDPLLSEHLWELKQLQEQRQKFYAIYNETENNELQPKQLSNTDRYNHMITLSMPVFDRSENETRASNLLGVAGTDVPLKDIKLLLSHFPLGVNGYAFIVTNNGHLVIHPDLRTMYEDILKPSYNNVDMLEVEIMDDDSGPRVFNSKLLEMRDRIVQQNSSNAWMIMKHHLDDMKRISRITRRYLWKGIDDTPFTLVITYPHDVGSYQIQTKSDDDSYRSFGPKINTLKILNGTGWKIHPDWLYCKNLLITFDTPEQQLLHSIEKLERLGWKILDKRSPQNMGNYLTCNRNLVQALINDAHATDWFTKNMSYFLKDNLVKDLRQRFGVANVFMATHSGLTRWHKIIMPDKFRIENEFINNNVRSVDEVWYKRAVELHYVEDSHSMVFSVPFDVGNNEDVLITASHAIFVSSEGSKQAPAAVTGFQFLHSTLFSYFKSLTSKCYADGSVVACKNSCNSENIDCYVIDNHGYVIIGEADDTGKFFGEIQGYYMKRLVEEGVFKEVKMYDYQAVCFGGDDDNDSNSSNILRTPIMYTYKVMKMLTHFLILFWIQCANAYSQYVTNDHNDFYIPSTKFSNPPTTTTSTKKPRILVTTTREREENITIKRVSLTTCDESITLYQLNVEKKSVFERPAEEKERPFVVVQIPHTNLILMVIDKNLQNESSMNDYKLTTVPKKIQYSMYNSLACFKSSENMTKKITRRYPPFGCFTQHNNESHIVLCGKGFKIIGEYNLIILTLLIHSIYLKVRSNIF